ncbi:hypothetical protein BS329_15750 [Amycolatopsis coloradensis]|uniref:Uncharacterized protein n=1 Tax=Amycolatopsis coloradensis TaxID=76021 RepID=A0A1R0KUK5_9PSEU|nr:hypothetical protein BS329_15750 [Amycolatopsis coloradensis]
MFLGVSSWPVLSPPIEILELGFDPEDQTDQIREYFETVGTTHADSLAIHVATGLRKGAGREFDVEAEIDRFDLFRDDFPEWGLYDYSTSDYALGLCYRLDARVDQLIRVANGTEPKDLFYSRDLEQGVAWHRDVAGDPPAEDVSTLLAELDRLIRGYARKAGIPLPARLEREDREREQAIRDRADLSELSAAIDRYSLHQSLPYLHSAGGTEQRAESERLVARIAVLDTRNPHLVARLPADRAQVVHSLLPESATRQHQGKGQASPPAHEAGEEKPGIFPATFTDAADKLAAHLLHPAAQGNDRTAISELIDRLAEFHQHDQSLADLLPTVQAGLVRNLDTVRTRIDDSSWFSTLGSAATRQVQGPQPQEQASDDALDPYMLAARASRFTFDANTVPVGDPQYRPWLVLHVERRGSAQWIIRRGSDGDVFNPDTSEFDSNWAVGTPTTRPSTASTGTTPYSAPRTCSSRRPRTTRQQALRPPTDSTRSIPLRPSSQVQRTSRPPVPARPGTAAARHSAAARSPGTARGR